MIAMQKIVVLQPLGQMPVVTDVPRGFPDLADEFFGLFGGVVGQRSQVDLVGEDAGLEYFGHLERTVILNKLCSDSTLKRSYLRL